MVLITYVLPVTEFCFIGVTLIQVVYNDFNIQYILFQFIRECFQV